MTVEEVLEKYGNRGCVVNHMYGGWQGYASQNAAYILEDFYD